jgi:hypothetical protein
MKAWMKVVGVSWGAWLSACAVSTEDASEGRTEHVAAASQALSRNALSERQEAIALKAIDDICGDTWCEGDHNFRFDSLACSMGCKKRAGSCKLSFRVFSYDTDVETGPTYTRTCRTPGFTGFDSVVESFGEYHALTPAYYDALTQCISDVESHLPR